MKKTIKKFLAILILSILVLSNNGTVVLASEVENMIETAVEVENLENLELKKIEDLSITEGLNEEATVFEVDEVETSLSNQVEETNDVTLGDETSTDPVVEPEEETTVEEVVAEEPETVVVEEQQTSEEASEEAQEVLEEVHEEEPKEQPVDEAETVESDTEEDEEEISMPAQDFVGMKNDILVNVHADEGAFPEGTKMKLEIVNQSEIFDLVNGAVEGEVNNIKAVDITFECNDTEIEPMAPVSVSIRVTRLNTSLEQQVVHIDDNNTVSVIKEAEIKQNGLSVTADFNADAFSVYAVITTDDDVTTYVNYKVYEFYDVDPTGESDEVYTDPDGREMRVVPYEFLNKSGDSLSSQRIKNGDSLENVGTPFHMGFSFVSWVDKNGNEISFNTPITGIPTDEELEDEIIKVYAKYDNVYYVYFYENAHDETENLIYTTNIIADGESLDISDIKAPVSKPEVVFNGWLIEDKDENLSDDDVNNSFNPSEDYSDYIRDNNTIHLYPDFINVYWIRFDTNGQGGKFTAPISVHAGQEYSTVTKPANPNRDGYEFAGWFDAKEGGNEFTWEGTAQGDILLYAHWTPKSVDYKVLYWLENADDDNYSYLGSKTEQGLTGADTNAQGLTDAEKANYTNVDWKGFEVQDVTQNTIKADGSTVVNVYYSRKIVKLIFHPSTSVSYVEDAEGNYYRATVAGNGVPNYLYYKTNGNNYEELNRNKYYVYNTEGPLAYYPDGTFTLYTRSGGFFSSPSYNATNYKATITRYSVDSSDFIVIEAKYGSDIHEQWPENPNGGTYWYVSPNDDTFVTLVTTAPSQDTDYYYKSQDGRANYYIFMTQNLGTTGTNTNHYSEYASAICNGNSMSTTADDYTGIKGFSINAYSEANAQDIREINGGDPNATYDSSRPRSPRIGSNWSWSNTNHRYELVFYYIRNKYNIEFTPNDGTSMFTESGIYYEEDISNKAPTNYVIDETKITTNDGHIMTFKGWTEDEEGKGEIYDFTGKTMPASHLRLYGKWAEERYVAALELNGGALNEGESTWFNLDYGEKITKYEPIRNYVEDPEGTYYYHNSLHPGDKTYDRKAYYTENIDEATDTTKTYSEEVGAYAFLGWFEVIDGVVSDESFDFETGVTKNVTLRAMWRRTGTYTLDYRGVDTNGVGGQAGRDNNGYADLAEVVLIEAPKTITTGYVFDGWEIVNSSGTSLDNNEGKYYQPGETIKLNASAWAEKGSKVIHVQAHYVRLESSDQPVAIARITFNGNAEDVTANVNLISVPGYTGVAKPKITVTNNKDVTITGLNINDRLTTYTGEQFKREGYRLIGWAKDSDITREEFKAAVKTGDAFELGQLVGVDNVIETRDAAEAPNNLYAVWDKLYTVHYEYTGDVIPEDATALPEDAEYVEGEAVTVAAPATATGYTFSGWNKENFDMPAEDVTIQGSWTINSYNLTINYKFADGNEAATTYTSTVEYKSDYSVDSPVIAGYTVDRATVEGTMPAADVTETVTYTPNTNIEYTVKYVDESGKSIADDKVVKDQTMATTVTEKAEEIPGYTVDEEEKSLKLEAENNVITFVYSANTDTKYIVEFYYESEGSYSNEPTSKDETRTGTTDTEVSVKDEDKVPTIDGYIFDEDADNVLTTIIAGTGDSVLKVYFKQQFKLTSKVNGENGTIDPDGETVVGYGENQKYTFEPAEGYTIKSLLVDEEEQTAEGESREEFVNNGYHFENINADHEIIVEYAADENGNNIPDDEEYFKITSSVNGGNGTINPDGETTVQYGKDQGYTFAPAEGYTIKSILVDEEEQTTPGESREKFLDEGYLFEYVTKDHTIVVSYSEDRNNNDIPDDEENHYTITAIAGDNGSVDPEGDTDMIEGESLTIEITPAEGYTIKSLKVDDEEQTTPGESREEFVNNGYPFENITADHVLEVTFAADENGNNIPDDEEYRTIIYTDGVEDEEIFTDVKFEDALDGLETPAFSEDGTEPERPGYVFDGWDPEVSETVNGDQTYTAIWTPCTPVIGDPPVKKVISGDKPETAETFKFTMKAESNTVELEEMPMPEGSEGQEKTVEIVGEGEYEFGDITFTLPGTYVYSIIEENTGAKNYKYDSSIYTVTYVITQEGSELVLERTIEKDGEEADDVVFTNEYKKPQEAVPAQAPVYNAPAPVVAGVVNTGDSISVCYLLIALAIFALAISYKAEALVDLKRRNTK